MIACDAKDVSGFINHLAHQCKPMVSKHHQRSDSTLDVQKLCPEFKKNHIFPNDNPIFVIKNLIIVTFTDAP